MVGNFNFVRAVEGDGAEVIINSPGFYCVQCEHWWTWLKEELYPDFWIPVRVVVIDQREVLSG